MADSGVRQASAGASEGGREQASAAQRPRTRASSAIPAARVLVVAPRGVDDDRLVSELRAQLVEPTLARDEREALEEIARRRPDAILLEAEPSSPDAAIALARRLAQGDGTRIPLAVIASEGTPEQRVAAAAAGALLYLERPLTPEGVGLTLRRLLDDRRGVEPKVLVLDDDEAYRAAVGRVLRADGFEVCELDDPRRVIEVLDEAHPDVLLVDAALQHLSGYDVCRVLRTSADWQELPIVFLTSRSDLESRLAAFRAGADDYVDKSADAAELLARTRGRYERTRTLRERGDRDFLTGLLRRGAFLTAFLSMLHQARRRERPVTLGLLDLDRFKDVNDRHGHLAGDRVLVATGKLLTTHFRREDVPGRWGGEELVVAFPETGFDEVVPAFERLLDAVSAMEFQGDGGVFSVSFSVGVATYPRDGRSPAELFAVADRRLYVAKRLGRARVVAEG